MNQNFVDYVKICCRSGRGGAGAVHFRREKYVAKGGPDGGDGGHGGSIILRGNKQKWTLLHLKYRKHIIAQKGENGQSARKTGVSGKDIVLDVPVGTIAKDAETGNFLFEIAENGQEKTLQAGGRGGLGNWHFKSATNQVPMYAQPGEEGKESWIILELKILADVGLVGYPNAGKSTLLSVVSAAKPKIADYAFTTLVPHLGMISYKRDHSFVMADIPGIIKGAAKGKGLGHRFLKHIERNACLLFIIPSTSNNIKESFSVLVQELEAFNPALLNKRRILAISKCDLIDEELKELIKKEDLPKGLPYVFISAVTGTGIEQLKELLWKSITDEL